MITTKLKLLTVSLLCCLPLAAQSPDGDLKFSNTQKLDEDLASLVGLTGIVGIDWSKTLTLPPPPSSQLESKYLLQLQKNITPSRIERIKKQADINFSLLAGNLDKKPNTFKLMEIIRSELISVILQEKIKFDRVRPSIVNPKIKLYAELPNHPAYPSGHATQAHIYSYAFAALNPSKKLSYLDQAQDISINREYAGLHYRSDSHVGKMLAKSMIRQLAQNELFQTAFLAASQEWGGDGVSELREFLNYGLSK